LAAVRVPPTLTGVLQTRLDSLQPDERTILQRAAVIGRLFWDTALAALQSADDIPIGVNDALNGLLKRELIYPRDTSAVAGAREYIFGSSLLRDVAYESALKRQQRAYHARVAEWLIETGGERAAERQYTTLIADHYERAGEDEKAAEYLKRAGEQAIQISALREAMTAYEHALSLLEDSATPEAKATRMVLLIRLGDLRVRLSDYAKASEQLLAGLTLAREAHAAKLAADALSALCLAAARRGAFADGQRYAEEAIELAREAGDKPALALALRRRGVVAISQGDYETVRRYHEDSLTLYRELNDQDGIASCLNNLGVMATNQGNYVVAARYYEESLALARNLGDREAISRALHNLGEVARVQGQHAEAARYYEESLAICRELGTREIAVTNVLYLGDVASARGDEAAARRYYHAGLAEAMEIDAVPRALQGLAGMAELAVKHHQYTQAAELLGLALNHPACDSEVKLNAEPVMAALRSALPADELTAALARGQAQTLEAVVSAILSQGA
jgi:predicted ATPase